MADFLELDSFELSVPDLGLSLSVWSHLYVSNEANSQLTCQELHACVRAGQLWFLPPRICYLQIIVQLEDRPIRDQSSSSVLEFLEGSIRLSTLWKTLGLYVKPARIQYETETASTPNLYFEVEHADNSSALLSPPNVNTSTMDGIVCLFRFSSSSSDAGEIRSAGEDLFRASDAFTSQPAYDTMVVENVTEIEQHSDTTTIGSIRQYRQRTADLAIAAMYKIIGVNKRHPGIRLGSPISTTLLELAPTVWNAHYMQATTAHSRNFSVISNIITATSGWRPSLVRKVSKLVDDGTVGAQISGRLYFEEEHKLLQASAQERLWTLLKSTMNIKTGMDHAVRKFDRDSSRAKLQDLEIQLFQHQYVDSAEQRECPSDEPNERCDLRAEFESDSLPEYKYHLHHASNELHMDTSGSYNNKFDCGNDCEHQYECEAHVAFFDWRRYLQSQDINGGRTPQVLNNNLILSPKHRHGGHRVPVEEVGRRNACFSKHVGYNGATFQDHEFCQLRHATTLVGSYTNDSMESDGGVHGSAPSQLLFPVQPLQKDTYSSDELPLGFSHSTQRHHSPAYCPLQRHIFIEDCNFGAHEMHENEEMSNRDAGLY